MPEQPRGFLDLGARNPADRFDGLRRVAPAEPGVQLEGRVADDLALRRGDTVFAVQREAGAVAVVLAGGGVIRHQPRRRAVPGEDAARIAVRFEVAFGQQAAGVGAHQVRPVAPLADEVAVVPAALDHQMGEAERQRAVGAGPHPQPEIGLAGEADMARVDDDQPHAALQRRDRGGRVGDAGEAGVVAPQDQHAAVARYPAWRRLPPVPTLPTP